MDVIIKSDERVDNIGFGNLRLIQKPEDFCYGIDAVLLASFAEIRKNAKVIDLGTGTGIIPIILSHKTEAAKIIGVEIQEDSYERASRNILLNNLTNRIKVINNDIKDLFQIESITAGSFDAVVSNPPYVQGNGGLKNDKNAKTIARHETTASLEDFIQTAAKLLKDRGDFYLVHRPNRLVDIAVLCRQYRLEPKKVRLVSPSKDNKPNILLVHCVKHGKPDLKFLDPLSVYDEFGQYTDEIIKIYERE